MTDQSSAKFHRIPDALWEQVDLVLQIYERGSKGGRPRLDMRNVATGVREVS